MVIYFMRLILIIMLIFWTIKIPVVKMKMINHGRQDDQNAEPIPANPNFMPKVMADDKILESINSLNSKQHKFFNAGHNWTKEYAKHNGVNVKFIICSFQEVDALVKKIYIMFQKPCSSIAKNQETYSSFTRTNRYTTSEYWWYNDSFCSVN